MITIGLSTTIGAPARQVWRALTDPAERVVWDERILGKVALPKDRGPKDRGPKDRRPQDKGSVAVESTDERPRRTISDSDSDIPQIMQWRFRLGGIPLVMQDRLISAQRFERLVSHVSIGSMQFDQTLTLFSEDDESGPHTHLAMKLAVKNSIAVIGELIPRMDVQKIAMEYVDATLHQIQKYCER